MADPSWHVGDVKVIRVAPKGSKTYLAQCKTCGWSTQTRSTAEGRRSLARHALDASVLDAAKHRDAAQP